ncbi:hypothetical protein GCM10009118_17310 [Wandonia haliotis]|uniref:PD-(D/E)XK nuclease superfamily protein n=1 Tax=Wandonia haliotis TaxID=574963 RepID=A0ABP3Y314_9FLAO
MQDFLRKANEIVDSYESEEKKEGNNFNLFSILDRETHEEKTHSALIAELLNPQGSHGQGDKFINLFISLLAQKKKESAFWKDAIIPNQLNKLQVYTERNIGKYRKQECRLDILLLNREWQIIIENKFNAKQGKEQLERYLDYLKEDKNRKTLLIYLTKIGDNYKSKELTNGSDYFCLTYKNDILTWLEKCKEVCLSIPIIEQSLAQYINLIKRETFQTVNYKMKNEIQELILDNGIKGASEIVKNYENALISIINDLQENIIAKLSSIPDLQNIRIQKDPFFSIFITVKNRTIGIEAFNIEKKTHRKNSLFIGELDFNKKNDKQNLVHTFWLKKSIETIWDENQKIERFNEYGKYKENREKIVNELVEYIVDYITRKTKD